MDYSYVSFVQRLIVEEQLRRDLAAQEWMAQTHQVAASNTGNAGMYEAANVLANSRISPSLTRASFVGNKHHLLAETSDGAVVKKRAKAVALPSFTSRQGIADSFPLPLPAAKRVLPVLKLASFQTVWDRYTDESKHVTDSGQSTRTFVKERFARHVVRFDANCLRSKLEHLMRQSKDSSGAAKCDSAADPSVRHVGRKRKASKQSRL